MRAIRQFPHCESRILHAPGECQYCDKHPDWQELRVLWGIQFTGHAPDDKQHIWCPADAAVFLRERGDYNAWHGNQPSE